MNLVGGSRANGAMKVPPAPSGAHDGSHDSASDRARVASRCQSNLLKCCREGQMAYGFDAVRKADGLVSETYISSGHSGTAISRIDTKCCAVRQITHQKCIGGTAL
jgi:hypothetical protein